MIFVAKWNDTWVRVCVENPDPLGEKNLVRLVDHGGYWICSNSQMRKIRSDYLTLPFQAIEIFLANIQAKNGNYNIDILLISYTKYIYLFSFYSWICIYFIIIL